MEDRLFAHLADGRTLSYAEYGDSSAEPVFYFHGWPGARYEGEMFMYPKIRLIAVERPGMGYSDFKAGRTLLDWADDVGELADILGINRFGVLGFSGGSPYAIACAYRMPERLIATIVVNGLDPLTIPNAMDGLSLQHRFVFHLARRAPYLLSILLRLNMASMRKLVLRPRAGGSPPIAMPECDRRLIAQHSDLRQLLLRDMYDGSLSARNRWTRLGTGHLRPALGIRVELCESACSSLAGIGRYQCLSSHGALPREQSAKL